MTLQYGISGVINPLENHSCSMILPHCSIQVITTNSVDHAASRNQSQAAVPTAIERLDHGLGKGENVVILELGAWRVRGEMVTTARTKGRGMESFFDDFS